LAFISRTGGAGVTESASSRLDLNLRPRDDPKRKCLVIAGGFDNIAENGRVE
jgi:hypothetical protein